MRVCAVVALVLLLAGPTVSQNVAFYKVGTGGGISGISPDGKVAVGTDFGGSAFYWTTGTGLVSIGEGEAFAVTNDTMVVGRFRDPNTRTPSHQATLVAGYWKDGGWTSIGGLPGVDPFDSELYSHGYGVSGDGSTIVGMGWYPNYRVEAFYWTEATGIVPLGQDGGFNSRANGASFDGSLVVGWDGILNGPDRRAYLWDPEPHFLGSFDSTYPVGECYAISPNGAFVVGTSVGQPFVWTAQDSMQRLIDPLIYPDGGTATDVNDNGTIVGGLSIGFFNSNAFFMTMGGEVEILRDYLMEELGIEGLEKWDLSWVNGISDDGMVMGGWGLDKSHPSLEDSYVVNFDAPPSNAQIELSIDSGWLPVPAEGDTVPFNITITNLTSESISTTLSVRLKLPDGSSKPVGLDHPVELGPNEVLELTKNFKVLAEGPEGTYKLVAFWGNYSEYFSTFSFEKAGTESLIAGHELRQEANIPVLGQNSPNPFNPSTTISFSLPEQTHVTLEVFNTIGQRVALLADEVQGAGNHSVSFNASSLASGVYIYRLQTPGFVATKKLLLIR